MTTRGQNAVNHGIPSTPDPTALHSFHRVSSPHRSPKPSKAKPRSPGEKSSAALARARSLSPSNTTSSSGQGITKREQLAPMSPNILFGDITSIKNPIAPRLVIDLWQKYIEPAVESEEKIVPMELKASLPAIEANLDTPLKTKKLPRDSNYTAHLYNPTELATVWQLVSKVAARATAYRETTHEAHWVTEVVGPLLSYIPQLSACNMTGKRAIEFLNISHVSIASSALCPTLPGNSFTIVNKKIDLAFAIQITKEESTTLMIKTARYHMDSEASINQSRGFAAIKFIFGNVEVKNDHRDPLIQLAVWIAAEFVKRAQEGYPMDVPVVAIAIDGDYWDLWIAYSVKVPESQRLEDGKAYQVRLAGPESMGDTRSIKGIFRILHVLKAMARWGVDVYEPQYLMKVLAKYI
ncbi:MAG: hypothetical protein Q9186_006744 [Xanthomendoza sp. 1 TL-2023]